MPESRSRYFIVEINGCPLLCYSIPELLDELKRTYAAEYYGADIGSVRVFEWHTDGIIELHITNSRPAEFDATDYAYPQWSVSKTIDVLGIKFTTHVGSFYIQIDGRA
jgi:hypothetical protein